MAKKTGQKGAGEGEPKASPHKASPHFAIRPHPEAPFFSKGDDPQVVIQQLINELSGNMTTGEEVRQYLRQAGLVNLWFFIKFIAGFAGAYTELNDGVHLDMANWRQSDSCMKKPPHSPYGARFAGFVPRGWYKSTIWTHGTPPWEIIRNRDIRIRLEGAKFDKPEEWLSTIKHTFQRNALFAWLYPEFVPPAGYDRSGNWGSDGIVVPCRTRHFPDPTISIGSMSGASEGAHVNLYIIDDPVGLDDLDSQRNSSVDMQRKKQRFNTNKTALLVNEQQDRVCLVGTRYALDDIYDGPVKDAYEFHGCVLDEFEAKPTGTWSIYNRLAEEPYGSGNYVFPEKTNAITIEKALEEDPWNAMTQLINYPQKAGMSEFIEDKPQFAEFYYDQDARDWVIVYPEDIDMHRQKESVWLSECDVVMSVDPAGTDKGIRAKTSRSSIGVLARDYMDRFTRIWSSVGYFGPYKLLDEMFKGHDRFPGVIRGTYVETNAMQKILIPVIRRYQREKGKSIRPHGVPASGDKVARIRNIVGTVLAQRKFYLVEGHAKEFLEEHSMFPMNQNKMDVLDETEKGITASRRPIGPVGRRMRKEKAERQRVTVVENAFGY